MEGDASGEDAQPGAKTVNTRARRAAQDIALGDLFLRPITGFSFEAEALGISNK